MDVICKRFNQREAGHAGALTFIEGGRDVPFDVKRIYYIYGVGAGERRGYHAHKQLQQYLICVHGSCKILMDNGKTRKMVALKDPNEGLYIGPSVWREMYDFTDEAVLLVLASEHYDEDDYIREYADFLKYVEEGSLQ